MAKIWWALTASLSVLIAVPGHAIQTGIKGTISLTASTTPGRYVADEHFNLTKNLSFSSTMSGNITSEKVNINPLAGLDAKALSKVSGEATGARTKASLNTSAFLRNNMSGLAQQVRANALIAIETIDKVEFGKLFAYGNKKFNFFDRIYAPTWSNVTNIGQATQISRSGSVQYSTEIAIFDNIAASLQPNAVPKLIKTNLFCNNAFLCGSDAVLGLTHPKTFSTSFIVDTDDVLFVTNRLIMSVESSILIGGVNFAPGQTTITYDYPLIAPGSTQVSAQRWMSAANVSSFVSALGADYTSGAVPEPQSWAMLIVGFGVVGGTMRHRRRMSRPRSVTA